MYGMVNRAIEDMVGRRIGDEGWERVKARAGVDVEVFISNESYPDELTYRLVGAAAEELGVPAAEVLSAFGEHWVLHTAREGYGGLMQANGSTLREFLENLPDFHTRVRMIFPALSPPRFECTDVTSTSLRLHYHTHRPGLAPFGVGLVRGLGKMFDSEVEIELVESRDDGATHDVFSVRWSGDT